MNQPQRLLNGAGDLDEIGEIEVALLRSAQHDAPSDQAVRRTLMALGVGGAAVATSVAASSAVAAAKAGASLPPVAGSAGGAGVSLLVKWVGIASVGALFAWGASSQLNPEPAPIVAQVGVAVAAPAPDVEPEVTGAPQAAQPHADQPLTDQPLTDEEPPHPQDAVHSEAEPLAAAPAAPKAAVRAAPKAASKPASKGDLVGELAALEKARKAMADNPKAALKAIDDYQKQHKSGVMAQEAEVMRIESLAAAGKKARARAAAHAFLAKHPSSTAAQRVRSILASLN